MIEHYLHTKHERDIIHQIYSQDRNEYTGKQLDEQHGRVVEISLTTFVDYVYANSSSHIGLVTREKRRYEEGYHPTRDYYKVLRDGIKSLHQSGGPKTGLDALPQSAHLSRLQNYTECVDGYKQWWGRKTVRWLDDPGTTRWTDGTLEVIVNPELLLDVNGDRFLIKLYFKSEKLSKRRIDAILHLIDKELGSSLAAMSGILDIRRGKLITPTRTIPNIDALLAAQAASFATLWDLL